MRFSILVTVIAGWGYCSCGVATEKNDRNAPNSNTPSPVVQQSAQKRGKSVLQGKWERTDAPYQLNVIDLMENGTMKAEYLNPKSIKVAQAAWFETGSTLTMYVELRDENYPGSYYKLTYVPVKDALKGTYFQAVESATYDVEFSRKK